SRSMARLLSCPVLAIAGKISPNATSRNNTRATATSQVLTVSHVSTRTRRWSRARTRSVIARTSAGGRVVVSSRRSASPNSFSFMVDPLQHAPQGALGVVQPRPDGAHRTAGHLRDLVVAHVFDEPQH